MNLDNMRELRDYVASEDNPVQLDMKIWFRHNDIVYSDPDKICDIIETHACGTAACLAGHAAILAWGTGVKRVHQTLNIRETAREWLKLTHEQGQDLFYGWWPDCPDAGDLTAKTKEQAIVELDRLIALEETRR